MSAPLEQRSMTAEAGGVRHWFDRSGNLARGACTWPTEGWAPMVA